MSLSNSESSLIEIKQIINESIEYRTIFNRISKYFNKLLGIFILDKIPIKKDFLSIDIERYNRFYKFDYCVKENSVNNLIIDFNFEMKEFIEKDISIIKVTNINDFLLLLMKMNDFDVYLSKLVDIFISNVDLTSKIETNITNLYFKIYTLFQNLLIELNYKNIGLKVRYKMSFLKNNNFNYNDSKSRIFFNQISYEDFFNVLFSLTFNEDDKLTVDIFDLIEPLYYDLIHLNVHYEDHAIFTDDLFQKFKSNIKTLFDYTNFNYILDHVNITFSNDFLSSDFCITPLTIENKLVNQSTIDEQIKYFDQFDFDLILNGRFFFPFIDKIKFNTREEDNIFKGKFFNLYFQYREKGINLKEVITDITKFYPKDDDFFRLFGYFINQFVIGEISLNPINKKDSVTLLVINLRVYNPMKENEQLSNNILITSIIEFEQIINITDLYSYKDFIKAIKQYFESIFYTYPMHSKIIGCSDSLYYLSLYDYFPTFRKYHIPLVENSEELILKLDNLNYLRSTGIFNYEIFVAEKEIFNQNFQDDKKQLKIEALKIKQFCNYTNNISKIIGMKLGEINIDELLKYFKYFSPDRMQKYYDKDFNYEVFLKEIQENGFSYLRETIHFLINNGYYFEINYFIENFIKSLFVVPYTDDKKYLELEKCLTNIEGITDNNNFIRDLQYFVFYPINYLKLVNFPTNAYAIKEYIISAGLILLFKKINNNLVIVLKLNKMRFNREEIILFQQYFPQATFVEDFKDWNEAIYLNKEDLKYGLIIKNFEIWLIKERLENYPINNDNNGYNFITKLKMTYYDMLDRENRAYFDDKHGLLNDYSKAIYKKLYKERLNHTL